MALGKQENRVGEPRQGLEPGCKFGGTEETKGSIAAGEGAKKIEIVHRPWKLVNVAPRDPHRHVSSMDR